MMLSGGINVIDTAINYRCQKAERTIGAALKTLTRKYKLERDGLFICTKNGYIPDDADKGIPAATLVEGLIDCGKVSYFIILYSIR
jgi:aryl-alcohol dehydrogenase-like predicted oxidoreductase